MSPDAHVMAAALLLAIATALLTIVWPAWRMADSANDLGSVRVSRRLIGGRVIVASQLAVVMALLMITGIGLEMLQRLNAVPLGFEAASVWTVDLNFRRGTSETQVSDTVERLRRTLEQGSAIDAVTYASPSVYGTGGWSMGIVPDGHVTAPEEDTEAGLLSIGPGFFDLLGLRYAKDGISSPRKCRQGQHWWSSEWSQVRRLAPWALAHSPASSRRRRLSMPWQQGGRYFASRW